MRFSKLYLLKEGAVKASFK